TLSLTIARTKQVARKIFAGKGPCKAPVTNVSRKPRKRRRTNLALQEIQKLQKGYNLLIYKTNFTRLQREAINGLQESAEAIIVNLLEDTQLLAIYTKRVTILGTDLRLAKRIRRRFKSYLR
ncbi:histone, partial [Podospora conica]